MFDFFFFPLSFSVWSPVRILVRGKKFNQLHNNGTQVIQANTGNVKIMCHVYIKSSDESYPSFIAPHILRVGRSYASSEKRKEKIVTYNLGEAIPSDSGIFTCRHTNKDGRHEHSLEVQVRGELES